MKEYHTKWHYERKRTPQIPITTTNVHYFKSLKDAKAQLKADIVRDTYINIEEIKNSIFLKTKDYTLTTSYNLMQALLIINTKKPICIEYEIRPLIYSADIQNDNK